ncbi:MAG: metallophosphoesterase [Candidatus Izemoplasmatales bacterium]
MRCFVSENVNKMFVHDVISHLKKTYLHIESITIIDNIRIGFKISKSKSAYVILKGYNSYSKVGKEAFIKYVDNTIKRRLKHLPIFISELESYKEIKQNIKQPIIDYIKKNEKLRKLNARRTRNFIVYNNNIIDLVYDAYEERLMFVSKIPFSNIEHDTNRKFTEEICIDLLLDYSNKKQKFIKLLSKPYDVRYVQAYKKYIDILNGDIDYNEQDIILMISILGRLNQEKQMGPISVKKDYKLNPKEIAKHITLQNYIVSCLSTIKEYANIYLSNKKELSKLGNIGFNGKLNKTEITPSHIPLLSYSDKNNMQVQISQPEIKGDVYSPNYIESFFKKITDLSEFNSLPILFDDYKDILAELTNYSGRYKGNVKPDFIVLAKIKSILTYKNFGLLIQIIKKKIYEITKRKTYYKLVSEHILSLNDETEQKEEFYKLLFIYEKFIASEIQRFMLSKTYNLNSEFNDDEISILSDMHFNDLNGIDLENFSRNFNIVAGDFYNNLYHRAGIEVNEKSDIIGIGVLGNHDVNWIKDIDEIKKEVETNYKKSITNLNRVFPNIKILNNEVFYKNGVAFVGLTIVSDEIEPGKRSFFANENLGELFMGENYFEITKSLLDSVKPDIPIVVISHSPFKEYAVCKNKDIGVFSNHIFTEYPNVKVYIHGHGHSKQKSEIIEGILCITNPIVNNIYTDSKYSFKWSELYNGAE